MKVCCTCKALKDPAEFNRNRSRPDGLQDDCRACRKTLMARVGADGLTSVQRWKSRNPEKVKEAQTRLGADGLTSLQRWHQKNPGKQRGYLLKSNYGLTAGQVDDILKEQGGECAICREKDKKWCVDHDHESGKVRALLCYCCNIAIGNLQDSSRLATAAAEYLIKHGK